MRMIVDSNFLQRNEMRAYLSQSVDHYAVLTDYAAMEAYKDNTLVSIYRSMAILAEFPTQVIVLKGTQFVCGLKGSASEISRQMIDDEQTREFSEYCRNLKAAEAGNSLLQGQLLDLGREANAHMERMLKDAKGMGAAFEGIAKTYTANELRILRTGATYTGPLIERTIKNILLFAGFLFKDHPGVNALPQARELTDRFIFRMALCGFVLALRWISVNGTINVKPERMRNDLVDINFAAFATYFDGLLTADEKLKAIHYEALIWLKSAFSIDGLDDSPTAEQVGKP
jgi:hypothetical protein